METHYKINDVFLFKYIYYIIKIINLKKKQTNLLK